MKFVLIIGEGAVGKMTVGQELAKITDLKLFHNHMSIEPVIEIFGYYNPAVVNRFREAVFEEFAKTDNYGMIFTYIWAFDQPADGEYIDSVVKLFEPYGTEFYCVELVAPMQTRLERNATENRRANKPSKRNTEWSASLIRNEAKYRCVSAPGEIPFENYLRIDNANIPAAEAARMIKEKFGL